MGGGGGRLKEEEEEEGRKKGDAGRRCRCELLSLVRESRGAV